MLWIVGACCLILFGAGIGVIGVSLGMLGYAIVGGIMTLAGIFMLVSFRRHGRYWGKAAVSKACQRLTLSPSLAEPIIGLLTKARSSPSPHNDHAPRKRPHSFIPWFWRLARVEVALTLFWALSSALLALRGAPMNGQLDAALPILGAQLRFSPLVGILTWGVGPCISDVRLRSGSRLSSALVRPILRRKPQ
jgi:hypothetical protein